MILIENSPGYFLLSKSTQKPSGGAIVYLEVFLRYEMYKALVHIAHCIESKIRPGVSNKTTFVFDIQTLLNISKAVQASHLT